MQNKNNKIIKEPDQSMAQEEMRVDLTLDDDTVITCSILSIFPVGEKEYIALLPLDENGTNTEGEYWIYGYSENPDNPNEEPKLRYIEDDDEYERAADAFDEYLDSCEFDELL